MNDYRGNLSERNPRRREKNARKKNPAVWRRSRSTFLKALFLQRFLLLDASTTQTIFHVVEDWFIERNYKCSL